MPRKNLVRYVFGLLSLILLLGHAMSYWRIPLVQSADAYIYDARIRLFASNEVDDRVVIVDIDEKSLAQDGRWPWSRDKVAAMIKRLTDDYKVAVVGFDVVFAEPDDHSGLKSLEALGRGALKNDPGYQASLQKLRPELNYDQRFADVLKGRPVVMGYYFTDGMDARKSGKLPDPVFPPGSFPDYPGEIEKRAGYGANLALFQDAAGYGGHFMPLVDPDGVTRRVPLLVEHEGAYYQSISLAMVRLLLGQPDIHPGYPGDYGLMEWIDLPTTGGVFSIPVDRQVAALVPYRGGAFSYPYVSASDVISGKVDPAILEGRIVIVGTTAPGLNDLRSTPVSGVYPGVEVHANLVAGMLDGRVPEKPGYVLGIDVVQILVVGLLLGLLLPRLSPIKSTILTLVMLSLVIGMNWVLWSDAFLVIPIAGVLILSLVLYLFNMSWGYFAESRTKRQFTELFGQYVPPELVDEMAKNPESYSMDGRNAELTVLFSDVRSFTTISEGMEPQALTQMMNEYLGSMTEVVRDYHGTLDKYIGDAIMAFWGAPVDNPNHALDAVMTAMKMQEKLKLLAEPFKAKGWPVLEAGIGLNTGIMTVGDMGSVVRRAYTVMGDTVNAGARLEGLTKEYGVGILVGENTKGAVPSICFREIDCIRVKGKDKPLTIYEPVSLMSDLSDSMRAELEQWALCLSLYRQCKWDEAEALVDSFLVQHPGRKLFKLYKSRIAHLRHESPGENWDGVTTFTTK